MTSDGWWRFALERRSAARGSVARAACSFGS
jgi:hypothetical protein